jgi:8-oxo-dGTP pyrophosphatase MutT (NUDIX family)/phosphohistidine phosphatase SixA
VVWRPGAAGPVVALVHRPRYDDWSLPKGKAKRGEHSLAAAVREVAEETGVRAIPQFPLPQVRYWLGERPKLVDYWAMAAPPAGIDDFQPNSEVDGLAWLPVTEAVDRLSYGHDAALLRDWASLPPVTGTVLLARHADAGERWPEGDTQRPLSSGGVADADTLCQLLALFAPVRLVSASPLRCRQTLEPLTSAARLPIEVEPLFDELTGDPAGASDRLDRLARTGATTVICSQRVIVPAVLARITGDTGHSAPQWRTPKGDGWVLSYTGTGWLPPAPLHAKRVRR